MWIFNIFLYLMFAANSPQYSDFVSAGAPCYVMIGNTSDPQPACWYDPNNLNSGQ
jgi:hypothetical protein